MKSKVPGRRRFNPCAFDPQNLNTTTEFAAFCDPTLSRPADQVPAGEGELVYFILYNSSGASCGGYMCPPHVAYDVFRLLKERGANQFSIKEFQPGEYPLITASSRDWYPLQ